MSHDQAELLKLIATQSRKKIRKLNLFDPKVCTSPADPKQPWMRLRLPGDFFRDQLSIEHDGRKIRLRANEHFMVVQISGSFDIVACSFNRRDLGTIPIDRAFVASGIPALPIFARRADSALKTVLDLAALRVALRDLELQANESLHLYSNAIELYLQRASVPEIISTITIACKLADQLPAANQELDLSALPDQFIALSGLIRRWAVSDDLERTELLDEASNEALEKLVKTVTPHLEAIDGYLNSFGVAALSEAAIALGALAECAVEARLRLESSRGN
jgi:hypothetical protein